MCMSSGIEPSAELSGAPYVQAALSKTLGNFGPIFITVAMILFAFTTLLGNLYYTDKAIIYLLKKEPSKSVKIIWYIAASAIIFAGAGLNADILWGIADITMGGMTVINMPVILYLSKYAISALEDYETKRKQGAEITFKKSSIGIKDETDYWN